MRESTSSKGSLFNRMALSDHLSMSRLTTCHLILLLGRELPKHGCAKVCNHRRECCLVPVLKYVMKERNVGLCADVCNHRNEAALCKKRLASCAACTFLYSLFKTLYHILMKPCNSKPEKHRSRIFSFLMCARACLSVCANSLKHYLM